MNHPNSRYRMVIFDLDGTLVDTSKGIISTANEALSSMGYGNLPEATLRECIGPPLADSLISRGLLDERDKDRFNGTFRSVYKERMLTESFPFEGIEDVLRINKERGVINAVATNKPDYLTDKLLHELKLDFYFTIIIGSNPQGYSRKEDMIEGCIMKTGVPSKDVLFVGDTLHDMEAANNRNVDFIGVNYGFGFTEGDEGTLRTPLELLKDIYDDGGL